MKLEVSNGIEENERIFQVGKIIYSFNLLEEEIKRIICNYIKSSEEEFIKEILLNNMIINFNNKFSIILYIIKEINFFKKPAEFREFNKCFKNLMNFRNQIAHTDKVIYSEKIFWTTIVDKKDEYFGCVYEEIEIKEPYSVKIANGKKEEKTFSDIFKDFEKYNEKAIIYFEKLQKEIIRRNYSNENNL